MSLGGRDVARCLVASLGLFAATFTPLVVLAGSFDSTGNYHPDPDGVVFVDFSEELERHLSDNAPAECRAAKYEQIAAADALEGDGLLELRSELGCSESFDLPFPREQGSYTASLWTRHGMLEAQIVAEHPGGESTSMQLAPTGRTTSDGWVELASNEFPVDGASASRIIVRLTSYSGPATQVDALEILRSGEYVAMPACSGHADPVCGPEAVCRYRRCRLGRLAVPRLPPAEVRDEVVDVLASRVAFYFGGKASRAQYLPSALATFDSMRSAQTAWEFWGRWARGMRALHDPHTITRLLIDRDTNPLRLNACFLEGVADLSHAAAPPHPTLPDILVSHVGPDAAGLAPGDRLVAIDGQHPLAWYASVVDRDVGVFAWPDTDPDVRSSAIEALGGPWYLGGMIPRLAESITIVRCDAASGSCAGSPETIQMAALTANASGGADVVCDNRPAYHLAPAAGPDPSDHVVGFHSGSVADTTPEEAIYGVVWNSLGAELNAPLTSAVNQLKANARGVILDHRTGDGGTLGTAEILTKLVRPTATLAVMRTPIDIAGWNGPADAIEGLALFGAYESASGWAFDVGSPTHDPTIPVALLITRDISASDFLAYGMKGAPKTRVFGPGRTSGAFSTYLGLRWWPLFSVLASGDTFAWDGAAMVGHGVEPDEIVVPTQSDLLAGKDTLHEAALAWVRSELSP